MWKSGVFSAARLKPEFKILAKMNDKKIAANCISLRYSDKHANPERTDRVRGAYFD